MFDSCYVYCIVILIFLILEEEYFFKCIALICQILLKICFNTFSEIRHDWVLLFVPESICDYCYAKLNDQNTWLFPSFSTFAPKVYCMSIYDVVREMVLGHGNKKNSSTKLVGNEQNNLEHTHIHHSKQWANWRPNISTLTN